MKETRGWAFESRLTLFIIAAALVLGWLLGELLLAITVSLTGLLSYYLFQMRRLSRWLDDPAEEPPFARGIWGHIFDEIYLIRRRDAATRDQLQSSINYLRDSLASMRDGAIIIDRDGRIQWSNAGAERLLGLRYPEDGGQNLLNLVRIPTFHHFLTEGDYGDPITVVPDSSQEQQLEIEISRFGDGDRLIFVRDVTEKVRLDRMRRDFVANVSHELRTPLTVISGYLGTILAMPEGIPQHYTKPLEQMQQQAERMENLLKDLLWLSRIESVTNLEEHELIDMCGMLEELRDDVASGFPGRVVELKLESDAVVDGDYRQLYSAVSNLVINALKYSPEEQPVTVRWSQGADGVRVLDVIDRGPGIEAVHLPRLTERFYRVDGGRATSQGGTGLGLAIVKHVLVSHRAELSIESEPGQGSCFSIIFPAHIEGGTGEHAA